MRSHDLAESQQAAYPEGNTYILYCEERAVCVIAEFSIVRTLIAESKFRVWFEDTSKFDSFGYLKLLLDSCHVRGSSDSE